MGIWLALPLSEILTAVVIAAVFSYRTPALHAAFGRFLTQAVVHGGMCCGADEPGSHPYNRKGDTISVPPFRFFLLGYLDSNQE